MIGIEDGIVEFHRNNETTSCKYDYDGYKILTINQARKAFVTYSNVKILKAKPLNIYNLAII